jgi:ATP-dependent metalloprotease FtsH
MSDTNQKKSNPIPPRRPKPEDKDNKDNKHLNFYWVYALIAAILIGMMMFSNGNSGSTINYGDFTNYAEQGYIDRLEYDHQTGRIYLDSVGLQALKGKVPTKGLPSFSRSPEFSFNIPPSEKVIDEIITLGKTHNFKTDYKPVNEFGQSLLIWIIGFALIIGAWVLIMRRLGGGGGPGGQIFNIGKSKAQLFEKGKSSNITFNDVAGLEGAKTEIQEIVEFLKHPKKYTELGAKIPKGALLVGPPGTGKTLLAKAVAGEAQVPFFSLSGSDFVEMFVGVGASRVRDLFRQAKEKAPAIIFIDEIDAIGRARSKSLNFGGNDERENTLNQLLTEMDGFATNSGIIILAATNRADILDKALLRAGRFDRQIYVDMPDLNERVQIFNVHLKNVKIDNTVEVEFLSKQTPGFSGADIANICNEAALIAARKGRPTVGKEDFLDAVDRIIGGLEKKNKIITPIEKSTIAYHESGHAIVSWLLEHASPLVKVTIVPRGRSLGAAWYLPEERQLNTTEQLMDEMCAALGGRAAEEVAIGKISTGALSDLEKVTKQAYAMVSVYGLNKAVGNRSYYDSSGESQFTKPYSEETARMIDQEVSKLIEKAYDRAKDLLLSNRDKLDQLAKKLLDKEVIFKDDLEEVLGSRKWDVHESHVIKPAAPEAKPTPEPDANATPDATTAAE